MLSNKMDLSETTMGDGVHWLKLQTAVSKRYGFLYLLYFYFGGKKTGFGNSIFKTHANRNILQPEFGYCWN